jgi:hypothetical protein
MDAATGEAQGAELRVAFDRRLKLEFHGARTSRAASISARVGRCPRVILPLSVTVQSMRRACVHEEAHLGVRAGLLGLGERGGETRADEARSATPVTGHRIAYPSL